MSLVRYLSHADVNQDPLVPVTRWSLSSVGRTRVEAMLDQRWVQTVGRVVSSDETKAVETASLLANRLGLTVEVRPRTGEIDRIATGYVTEARYQALATRFFAEPTESADGWERAIDAQRRVVNELSGLLTEPVGEANTSPDVAVVGHGGVGTLLWCHLTGRAIDARHDQPSQGHFWTWDRSTAAMVHPWHPVDDLTPPSRWPGPQGTV